MSITHPRFTTRVHGTAEMVFELIADMPHYGRWLPGSEAFGGTTQVAPYPVQLGTTYLDAGPAGKRPGSVTGFDPPRFISFHHTMLSRKGPLRADIDVHIRYRLEPQDDWAQVIRELDLSIEMPWAVRLMEPLVLRAFRKENERILAELKRHVEAQAAKK